MESTMKRQIATQETQSRLSMAAAKDARSMTSSLAGTHMTSHTPFQNNAASQQVVDTRRMLRGMFDYYALLGGNRMSVDSIQS